MGPWWGMYQEMGGFRQGAQWTERSFGVRTVVKPQIH